MPGLGTFPGVGNGNGLQYSCMENSMDREAWWATVQVRHNWAIEHTHTHTHTHTLQMYINFPCLKEYPPPKMDHLSLSLTYGSHHPPWSHQSLKSWLHSSLIFYLLLFCSYHQSPSYGIRKSIFFFSCFLPCKYCIWKVYLPPKTISATSKCVSLPSICWASHICFIQTLLLFF